MGIPKFNRFITNRYPGVQEQIKDGSVVEIDNFFVDMNGIIHLCTHPEEKGISKENYTAENVYENIFHFVDVLFDIVKPKKLLFLAVDGVAPRAKLNQQRSSRFQNAREREFWKAQGPNIQRPPFARYRYFFVPDPDRKPNSRKLYWHYKLYDRDTAMRHLSNADCRRNRYLRHSQSTPPHQRCKTSFSFWCNNTYVIFRFDGLCKRSSRYQLQNNKPLLVTFIKFPSGTIPVLLKIYISNTVNRRKGYDVNCITPGTKFMERLQKYLEYFITYRISTSPLWKNCKVILCGSKVPGEGEHKIMEYIRDMKMDPDHDPFARHCLYGLDADLIILGLCTKEKNVSILRERANPCGKAIRLVRPEKGNFSLIHLSLLREYLDMEFTDLKKEMKFPYSLERIIDDWVLMGFLVGNDYIPHLAGLHIERGAIQLLYRTYIEVLPTLNGYINEDGDLHFERFRAFMKKLAKNIIRNIRAGNYSYFDEQNDSAIRNKHNSGPLFTNYRREYYRRKLKFGRENFSKQCKNLAKEYVRGLQWILHYYYRGCKSWSWSYPEHYGPCASSIEIIGGGINFNFQRGKPFLPYEQLLAVLPPGSKNLLPKCYRKLMTAEESSIKKYYPKQFKTDLNGKRNDWEAVVLLPMINEEDLLDAMVPCNSNLKTLQKLNNTHSDMLVYSYTESRQAPVSTPRYFREFSQNHASVESITLDQNPTQVFRLVNSLGRYRLQPDTYFPGFPTFSHINHAAEKIFWEVQLPRSTIKIEKVIVSITESDEQWNGELAMKLLGKNVHVNWPNLSEARIVELEDENHKYPENGEILEKFSLGEEAKFDWTHACSSLHNNFLERGIEIGTTKVIAYVNYPKGIRRYYSPGGVFLNKIVWSEKTYAFPLQTIVKDASVFEPHLSGPILVGEIFPPNTDVFSLEYSTYGYKGQIKKKETVSKEDGLLVKLEITRDRRIDKQIAKYKEPHYYSASAVGKKLDISSDIVEKIAGSILINLEPEDFGTTQQSTLDIGLRIKNSESDEKVPGYTKKEDNWMYSDKAIALIQQYIKEFPTVVDFLLGQSIEETSFNKSDFTPGFNDIQDFKQIVQWVQSLECSRIERVLCDSKIVQEEFIEKLKQVIDSAPCELESKKLVFINPEDLFTNNLVIGDIAPVATTRYKLFDRIVYVARSGIAPLGARGYITGIINTGNGEEMYDILFDRSLADGFNFNPKDIRKLRISQADFINITRGKMDLATRLGHVNTNFLKSYRQTFETKVSSICSMLAEKLRTDDLMMKLRMGFNKSEKEEPSTVSNSSIKQAQEKLSAYYRSRIYNPCILPSPSLQLFRYYDDGIRHFHQYMLRSIQNNDSQPNTHKSNPLLC